MTTQVLRPNATVSWSGTVVNAATAHAAQSDNNPASTGTASPYTGLSYCIVSAGGTFDLTSYTLAANERVERVRARIWTATASVGFTYKLDVWLVDSASGLGWNTLSLNQSYSNVREDIGSWQSTCPRNGGEWLQADLDNLRILENDMGGTTGAAVFEVFADVDVRHQPTVTVTGPTGTNPGTNHQPVASWTYTDSDGTSQNAFWLKVFPSSTYTAGGFDPETWTPYYTSGEQTNNGSNLHQIKRSLPNGTYRCYVKVAKLFRGVINWYSTWQYSQFVISDSPPAPTGVGPGAGETVNTDLPTLKATVALSSFGNAPRVKSQWQIAQDFNFTTGLKTIDEPTADFRNGGATTEPTPTAQALFQGTWYVRARELDELGGVGPYATTSSFIVSHPPVPANLVPTGDVTMNFAGSGNTSFTWYCTDTSSIDYQTAYQIIIEQNSDGTQVIDTGKVSYTVAQGTQASTSIVIPALYKDAQLRWKIRLWDSDNVVGAYSAYNLFRVGDPPTVAITAPVTTATTPSPQVTWTFNAGQSGRTQRSYRVQFTKNGVVVFDSGEIQSTATSYTPPTAIFTNGDSGTVTLIITDTALLGTSVSSTFTVTYAGPPAPTFSVDGSTYPTSGYTTVSWTRSPDSAFTNWRIYRRLTGDTLWTKIFETPIGGSGTGTYQDWTAASGVAYDYSVVQEAQRFGVPVESVYNVASGTGTGTEYYLVHPTDNTQNFHLFHVTSDQFTEEYESATLVILDKGRHTDYGARLGYTGSLACNLYDQPSITARAQRLALQALKAQQTFVYLRNPFGDIWSVETADIQIQRMSGVGPNEFSTVTIPYTEISS